MAAHIVALADEAAHHCGVLLAEASGEEETCLHILLSERGDDGLGSVGPCVGREDETDAAARRVALHNAALAVDATRLCLASACPARGKHQREAEEEEAAHHLTLSFRPATT